MDQSFEYIHKVSDKVFTRLEKVGYGGLAVPEKVFYCVWVGDGYIGNGGFDSFFCYFGQYCEDTVWAFESISAFRLAKCLREAASVFPNNISCGGDEEWEQHVDDLSESSRELWTMLETEYYKESHKVSDWLFQYCQQFSDLRLDK